MFDHTSRYYGVSVATLDLADGHTVSYARRRFLPRGDTLPVMSEITVAPGERIDLVASRVYGDPLAFWRLCDAYDAIDPLSMINEAAAEPGSRLRAPLPHAS
jgi:hypothetical protein